MFCISSSLHLLEIKNESTHIPFEDDLWTEVRCKKKRKKSSKLSLNDVNSTRKVETSSLSLTSANESKYVASWIIKMPRDVFYHVLSFISNPLTLVALLLVILHKFYVMRRDLQRYGNQFERR